VPDQVTVPGGSVLIIKRLLALAAFALGGLIFLFVVIVITEGHWGNFATVVPLGLMGLGFAVLFIFGGWGLWQKPLD